MKKRQAAQSEFKIADTPTDLRTLPLNKVRALRDALEAELLPKLNRHDKRAPVFRSAAEITQALNQVCLCSPESQAAYAQLLDSAPQSLRKQVRTLRTLAQFAAALERRAVQRPRLTPA